MNRERHCTVAQLREAISTLREDDVICAVLPNTGNLGVFRDVNEAEETQLGFIELAPQDLGKPFPPKASLELF